MSLLNDEVFCRDIESLRGSSVDILQSTYENIEVVDDGANADEVPSPLHKFMMKHNLTLVMEVFIYHYVTNDDIDLDKLRNGVYIVDDTVMEASCGDDRKLNYHAYVDDTMRNQYIQVTLAVPVHATITQINDTINQHKQFIKDRQTAVNNNMPVKRVKLQPKALRNNEIMRLYGTGLKPREILWALADNLRGNLTAPDISKIINKQKSK